jgi:ATP-dependent Clp protease ATP-binding subunit ClpC
MTDNDFATAFGEGRSLTAESVNFVEPMFRSELVTRVVQVLGRRGSVLLIGASGVGKTSIVHGVASQMRQTGGAKIHQFSVSQLLTGTKYLGEWESKATQIIKGAVAARAILYFSDVWNLPSAAKTSDRDVTAWDLIRPYVESGRLQLIGEMSPEQLLGTVRAPGFATSFEAIPVPPLASDQIGAILAAAAKRMQLDASATTIHRAHELCQQFMAASEGPAPALEMLAQVRDYLAQKRGVNEPEDLSPQFVEKVFSIYSGLPLFVVSPSATKPVAEISAWFQERIIGQRDAVRAVVEAIALYKSGLHDPSRPIGSFLFVGPTGVGKTELARALARFLFGTENRLLRFDLSEYKDYHAFEVLIGDPDKPERPARLVDPVRSKPFQVVLFDEIEKGHENVWDLMLQVLDEGRLTPASGKTVSFRNTIVIATSNVGAAEGMRPSPGFVADADATSQRMRQTLEAHFRPEFLNRFQHVVFFHPLTEEQVRQIARIEVARVLARQGIADRKIAVDVTPPVFDLIVKQGYDPRYGARALRRMVQRHITVPIATLLLERAVADHSILRLVAAGNDVKVSIVETPESRAHKAESRPIKTRFGRLESSHDIKTLIDELKRLRLELVEATAHGQEAPSADSGHALDGTTVWQSPEALGRAARRREIELASERRLARLLQHELELERWIERAATREERQRVVGAISHYEVELHAAQRELVQMPPGSVSDAIVELVALGPMNASAIELFGVYSNWANRRGHSIEMVCEPLSAIEPIVAAVGGHFAYGYLHLESGLHRFRGERENNVVRVRVLPWIDRSEQVPLVGRFALKKTGLLGGRVRSRLQVEGSDLVIQNERTLAENGGFAATIAPSYLQATLTADTEVRRYDRDPFLLKDHLTGTTGRSDALSPERFHELLCDRIAAAYAARSAR